VNKYLIGCFISHRHCEGVKQGEYMFPRKNYNQNVLQEILEELDRPARLSEMPRRIELCRQALAMVSKEAQAKRWGALQNTLAISLAQTPKGERAENLEQAIDHYRQALEVYTRQDFQKEWAMTQHNLATTYRDRIRGERAENIEQAIQHYQQALEVRTREADPERWALTEFNLAGAYYRRIRGERAENLEQATQHSNQALKVYTRKEFPHFWAQVRNTLGEVYRVRIRGSRMENIEQAIQCFKQALEENTRQAFPEDWAMSQNNLGNAYLGRIRGERAENVEKAIRHYQQALKVRTPQSDPERWAMTQYNLGNAYRNRIRGDQTENIEQSIWHFEQALEVRTRESFPEDWAQTQNNLGNAYLERIHGERADNIEMSIRCYEQALEVRTPEAFPEDWAQTLNNLGNAYLGRIRGERAENIEEAIQCYQQALEVRTRESFPEDWAQTLNNLAGAERTRAAENIEQAIQRLQQSLEVYTRDALPQDWASTQNNLAIAYTNRIQGERSENIEQAIQHYRRALEVYTSETFPDNCLKTARALGNLAFEQQRWELAKENYDIAFNARDVLLHASLSRTSKQTELGEAQNLPPRAAYAYVQLSDAKGAVEVLERGRAQLLRESLERRWVEQLPTLGFKNLYEDYMKAMRQYDALYSIDTSENIYPEDLMFQALDKVQAATAAIREKVGQSHPQYRYFLQALPFEEIQDQAQEKPLVYLCATSAGGLALVVSKQGVQAIKLSRLNQTSLQEHIWRPSDEEVERINEHIKQGNVTQEDIQAVRGGYFSMYALRSILVNMSREQDDNTLDAWKETLDETTRWLWDTVMRELTSVLKEHSVSATLIPVGQLAFLPLHAAWKEDISKPTGRLYVLDEINITYTPSAHALWQASLAAKRPVEKLLAVENPDGSLVFSKDEVRTALDMFKQAIYLPQRKATLKVVKEEMQKTEVLHFSTHGNAGWLNTRSWQEEKQAWLKLADGYLTLPDIFELDLTKVRLAVLSACETGVPDFELVDEMIGLPAGMMQAGVPEVVGSLWSVNEGSTALLMARFYRFWRKEGKTPQDALRQAQRWLRDSLFESPYYWAAFTYTGV
jgi:CHAT domain-containing protein/TPR repeat protein